MSPNCIDKFVGGVISIALRRPVENVRDDVLLKNLRHQAVSSRREHRRLTGASTLTAS